MSAIIAHSHRCHAAPTRCCRDATALAAAARLSLPFRHCACRRRVLAVAVAPPCLRLHTRTTTLEPPRLPLLCCSIRRRWDVAAAVAAAACLRCHVLAAAAAPPGSRHPRPLTHRPQSFSPWPSRSRPPSYPRPYCPQPSTPSRMRLFWFRPRLYSPRPSAIVPPVAGDLCLYRGHFLRCQTNISLHELDVHFVHLLYRWIDHRLQAGLTLAFLLWLASFKSETSFGFSSPNYT